jgi:predicted RND superfamily exporter protein
MVLMGYEMTMVTNNVPILLLAVGSAYTIHVVNKINQVREKDYRKAIVTALAYIFIPVALAAVTTMVGFISFVFEAYLTMIKDFGIFTAIGTLLSAILALFFVPALLFGLTTKNRKAEEYNVAYKKSVLSDTILKPLNNLLIRHPKSIVIFWIIQTIIGTFAIFLIERNVDIKDYFQEGDMARRAEEIMTEKFGGSKPIFVLFKGDVQEPEVLNMMLKTEDYLKQNPHVYSTQSIANLIVDMNDALGEGRQIPDDRDKIEQLWFLIDGNPALEQLVSDDLDEAVIISKFDSGTNNDKKELAEHINEFIDNNRSENYEIQATGMPFIDLKMNKSLLTSQIRSRFRAEDISVFIFRSPGCRKRSLLPPER